MMEKIASPTIINPTLPDLEVFVGQWTAEIVNASFLANPSTVLQSSASFEWFGAGEFLVLRQGTIETAHAIWLIGHDHEAPNYTVLYADDRRISRVYEMSIVGRTWKIWRNTPDFSQRFEGTFSKDKNTIAGAWSKSSDGQEWAHDFDLVYKRIIQQ